MNITNADGAQLFKRALETHSIRSSDIKSPTFRLDASFYRADFANASRRVSAAGLRVRRLAELADAFVPGRTRLVTVAAAGAGAPYLRAHDAFEIRPSSHRFVAKARVKDYDSLLLKKGMILTPSSGRNLGPVAYVNDYLSRFAMTDIMRIIPKSEEAGFYLLTFLLTPTAQSLMRRGRSGTTVDHLSAEDVLGIEVPWIDDQRLRKTIASQMQAAEDKLQEGRAGLDAAAAELHREAGLSPEPLEGKYLSRECGDAFSHSSRAVGLRLDAANHDPTVLRCAAEILDRGGTRLGDVARPTMLGRYVRYYVEAPHGRPILSGRQILQVRPVNLKRISDRSFSSPDDFILRAGSTIFTCDGRSEEALGEPGYVMPVWDGWMASNHVMRLTTLGEVGHGYIYLAIASPWVQKQLKAAASGSVIDALEPIEVSKVIIPMIPREQRDRLDNEVQRCWNLISESILATESVVSSFEQLLSGCALGSAAN